MCLLVNPCLSEVMDLLQAPFGVINYYCCHQISRQTKTHTLLLILCISHFYDPPLLLFRFVEHQFPLINFPCL